MISQQEMLKDLVKHVATSAPSKVIQGTEETVDEVIFESDVDGIRYYLVRCRPKLDNKVSLSAREQAIANLIAQGLPNKQIGVNLNISPWTVATHLRRIFTKLGVTSRAAMVARLKEENVL